MPYNYDSFPLDMEAETFRRFPRVLAAGGAAPDGVLTDAATEEPVRLSDLWRRDTLVIEFGSIT